jgi:signal transduction histidine kinase
MDTLVAAAIHDAKNGLNALNTWLGEARQQAPSPALDAAMEVSTRISAQLVELLAMYRAGEGTLRLAVEDHHLMDFCAETVAEVMPPAGTSGRIDIALAPDHSPEVWAFDAYQVKLVLQDALRNALRHARTRVTLDAIAETGGGLRFCVSDDGPGFPAHVLAGESGAMDGSSSGLGLRFARLIATHHATPNGRHGRVELSNQDGACFKLFLP